MSNDGGPAFPVECYWDNGKPTYGVQTGNAQGFAMGMSLRDYFAAAALTSLSDMPPLIAARRAFEYADAMLATRTETRHD